MLLGLKNRCHMKHIGQAVILVLLGWFEICECQFLIDQRYRDKNRIDPPADQFFKTFYDKSYYIPGSQKPIYQVPHI